MDSLSAAATDEPIPPWKDVDEGKLDSALHAPQHAFDGKDVYPELHTKAAVLLYSIAKAHALGNGNKRTALVCTLAFLALNGHWLEAQQEEVQAHIRWVAASEARLRDQVIAYLGPYIESRLVVIDFEALIEQADRAAEAKE